MRNFPTAPTRPGPGAASDRPRRSPAAARRDRRAAGKIPHGHHPLPSTGKAVRRDRQGAGSADGNGKDTFIPRERATTQASGRSGGNGIMKYDSDDALDRALFALPLEEPPADLRASILTATVYRPAPAFSRVGSRRDRRRCGGRRLARRPHRDGRRNALRAYARRRSARRIDARALERRDARMDWRPASRRPSGSHFSPDPNLAARGAEVRAEGRPIIRPSWRNRHNRSTL